MDVYRAVADELARAGVERVFGLLGEDVAKPMVAARELGIEFVAFRHENQAVSAADSYARTTGRVGIVAIAGGPGFTNALTAINTAGRFGSRVVVLIGGSQIGAKFVPHAALCAPLGITTLSPASPADVVAELGRAIELAQHDQLVVFDVPINHLDARLDAEPRRHEPSAPAPRTPEAAAIARLADFLQTDWAVRRPVLLAGRGAMLAGAVPALRELAERTGALLATTLRAHGAFADDPFDLGISGTYATPVASGLLAEADAVVAFGASLNRFTTFDGGLYPKARLVQVDVDEGAVGRHAAVDEDLSVAGDARLVAEALVAELDARGHRVTGQRTDVVARELAAHDPATAFTDQSLPDLVDPRTVAVRLDAALPDERVVVIDGGHGSAFALPYLRIPRPGHFVQTSYVGGASAIGLSLGAAIGAATGHLGTPVVCWVGDAAHLMSIGDVETAVRYQLPIVLVVCNDRALGAEVKFLELVGLAADIAEIDTPPFAAVAEAMGAEGFTVRTLEGLDRLGDRLAAPLVGPLVVDCLVNPAVRADWVDFMWAAQKHVEGDDG